MFRTYVRVGWRGEERIEVEPGVIEALFVQLRNPEVVPRDDPWGEGYLVIERADTDQFLQILGPGPLPDLPGYRVEYRDATGRMFEAETDGHELVEQVLLRYAFNQAGWHDLLDWRPFRP